MLSIHSKFHPISKHQNSIRRKKVVWLVCYEYLRWIPTNCGLFGSLLSGCREYEESWASNNYFPVQLLWDSRGVIKRRNEIRRNPFLQLQLQLCILSSNFSLDSASQHNFGLDSASQYLPNAANRLDGDGRTDHQSQSDENGRRDGCPIHPEETSGVGWGEPSNGRKSPSLN